MNYAGFLIGLATIIIVAGVLVLITGIIHNRKGYVSVIEKKHEFYRIEIRKFSWYMPLLFRKVAYYTTIEKTIKRKGKTIVYQINDAMLLYKSRMKVKDIIDESENIEESFKQYNITLISIN